MVHRWLDLVFQYGFTLLAALLMLPLALAGAYFALDRTQIVTTRIWVDRPSFLADLTSTNLVGSGTAADGEATLITELVHTDSFVDTVLAATDPGYRARSEDDRGRLRTDFQAGLSVSTSGPNVIVINYLGPSPARSVSLLTALLRYYRQTVESIELGQISTTGTALDSQLRESQRAMNDAAVRLNEYISAHAASNPSLLASDPTYITLSSQSQAKTSGYLSVLALSEQAQLAKSAIPSLRTSVFHVLDPPTVQPITFSLKSPIIRVLLGTLAGVATLEALLVYVLAKRDPRIRSGEEVEQRLGLRYLGSTPLLRRP